MLWATLPVSTPNSPPRSSCLSVHIHTHIRAPSPWSCQHPQRLRLLLASGLHTRRRMMMSVRCVGLIQGDEPGRH